MKTFSKMLRKFQCVESREGVNESMKISVHQREKEPILEMARIGWIPPENQRGIEVYVHTDDPGKVPHFHVRKYGRNNQFEWETCIRYDRAEYFLHGKYKDRLPDKKTARELDKMFRRKNPKLSGFTYWETCVAEWNINNSDVQLPQDIEQPNYTQLR